MTKDDVLLIVEDNDGHAGLVKKNLERVGITNKKLLFHNGEEVLSFLLERKDHLSKYSKKDNPSFVVLLDVRLPKIDGIEVLKKIKQYKELSNIPVIMLTTSDDPNTVKVCNDLGCAEYFVKPVDYNDFIDVINDLGLFLNSASTSGATPGDDDLEGQQAM